ncbi:MAG TPA: DUF6599 family protein [Terriglobales bacterium]
MRERKTARLWMTALLLCLLQVASFAQNAPAAPLLPKSFAGWTMSGNPQTSTSPAQADPAHPGVLTEDGLKDVETATYTNEGRKLTVKAARFVDASGAFAAFSFYREPRMIPETIGTMAASDNQRVLFLRNNVLVEAKFDEITAMSASELRELAAALPVATGPEAQLPPLLAHLPRQGVDSKTVRFIQGPQTYAATSQPISAQTIDFSRSPELITADVRTSSGNGSLLLIEYPTPAIAIEKLKTLELANPTPNSTYVARRSGPLLAVAWGSLSDSDARKLVGSVNYEAEVTWNEYTGLGKKDNIGTIVVGAFALAGIIFVFSVGTGAIFGFTRPLLAKVFPGHFHVRTEEDDFIRLHLKD